MQEGREETRVPANFDERIRNLTRDIRTVDSYLAYVALPQPTVEALSDAVDHIRATTWAVLHSLVDEFTDVRQVPSLLTSHRIQRTKTLLQALNGEMDTGNITRSTAGVEELCTALGVTYKKMHFLLLGKRVSTEDS